jgi:ammonia channel protein AmtB
VLDFAGGTVVHECWLGGISRDNVLGKRKLKVKSRITYIARNRSIVVWLVWFQCWFCISSNGIAVQALGQQLSAAAGMAWVF